MKKKIFECDCEEMGHAVRFTYWSDKEGRDWLDELYVETSLMKYESFLKRVWVASKYVLGIYPKTDHFYVDTLLHGPRIDELIETLRKWRND